MKLFLPDQLATEAFGALLWRTLPPHCLLFLQGDLGAGKTTLVRGLLRAAGYEGAVRSPTYSLVEEYDLNQRRIFHFDLYRLKDPEELEWLGIDDYLNQPALCCVEWPQMGGGWLPAADLTLQLMAENEGRLIELISPRPELINAINLEWKNNDLLL